MNEENREEETPQPWMNVIPYTFESERRKAQIYHDTITRLKTDKNIQEYFQQFNAASVDSFISSYAWAKCLWMYKKDEEAHWLEWGLLESQNEADKCLGNIQQKKLFNKQCQWRANQFKHPAVNIVADFNYWEHNILNCPFLEPITQQEVDLYIEFLNSYTGENLGFLCGWQDYDTYNSKKVTVGKTMHPPDEETDDEDDTSGNDNDKETGDEQHKDFSSPRLMPPWYIFYDERMGTGHYLLLPDLRSKKESEYWGIGHEEAAKKIREEWKTNPTDQRTYLNVNIFDPEQMTEMINLLESDPEVLRAYRNHKKYYSQPENGDEANSAWHDLSDCNEPFPMVNPSADWRECLIATAKLWKQTKLIRALPSAYSEYLMRLQAGLEQPYEKQQEAAQKKTNDMYKEYILCGRELKGEPRDFAF